MRLSIIIPDNVVVIDGRAEAVDLKNMPAGVRVVQWDGSVGHVEFYNSADTAYQPNIPLHSIDDYQWVIDAWNAAAAESDEKKVEMGKREQELAKEAEAKKLEVIKLMTLDQVNANKANLG